MDTSNKKYLELLNRIAESCRCEATVYENYSGRGMYGEKCHGISGYDFINIIETAALHGLGGASYDIMGHDYIVYWRLPCFSDAAYKEWGEEVDPN